MVKATIAPIWICRIPEINTRLSIGGSIKALFRNTIFRGTITRSRVAYFVRGREGFLQSLRPMRQEQLGLEKWIVFEIGAMNSTGAAE